MNAHLPRPASGVLLWWTLCLALALPAWYIGWVPLNLSPATWPPQAQAWALHPDAGLSQAAWTWWTTAWLHGSPLHLTRNLMALGLIALLGTAIQVSVRSSFYWALAWPLTHIGMLGQPTLHTYIGMSGVLHAAVAVMAMQQITQNKPLSQKYLGGLLLIGLIFKILMENPWQHALIQAPGSDITVAPWVHLCGAVTGIALSLFGSVTKPIPLVKRLTRSPRTLN